MASESPFDSLGTLVQDTRNEVRTPLYGGRQENAFTVAHRAVGEWRAWRALMELNDLVDPFDLSERETQPTGELLTLDREVNFTTDLGQQLEVLEFTRGIVGDVELRVIDTAENAFELTLSTTAMGSGAPVALSTADFTLSGGFVELELPLPSSKFVKVRFDLDTFLIIWLARAVGIGGVSLLTRAEVRVPPLLLGQ